MASRRQRRAAEVVAGGVLGAGDGRVDDRRGGVHLVADEVDPHQAPVLARGQLRAAAVVAPRGHVERAVGPELDRQRIGVVGRAELARPEHPVDAQHRGAVVLDARLAPPVLRAVEDQPRAVVVRRPLGVGRVGGVVVVDRAGDRFLRAGAGRDREARGMVAGALVPDVRRHGRAGDAGEAGVVRRLVGDLGRRAVEARAGRAARERVAEVGVGGRVVARAQRPAVEAGLGHAVPLDDPGRSTRAVVARRVGP